MHDFFYRAMHYYSAKRGIAIAISSVLLSVRVQRWWIRTIYVGNLGN